MEERNLGRDMRDQAFRLNVLNGIFFAVVNATVSPGTVLSAFFLKLFNSTFFATLPLALMNIGGLWPQLIISNVAEANERKKPFYAVAGVIRVVSLIIMTVCTFFLKKGQSWILISLIPFLYFIHSSGSGVCNLIWMDIVGKTVPANRRGSLMGTRGLLGGTLSFIAGFYVKYMLGDKGPGFPYSYGWLFIIGAVFQISAVSAFLRIPEPITEIKTERPTFKKHIVQGLSIFKTDKDYRLLFFIRILNSISTIGVMVFIPYALKKLGLPESIVGVLMVISTCFALPSNILWSRIGDKYGNRLLMLIATIPYLLVPIIAIVSSYVPNVSLRIYDLRTVIFIAAYTLSAMTMNGRGIGDMNYLLDLAPEEKRPSYVAFMSVMLAPTALVPLIGGMIAELISFQATFIISFVFGLGGYMLVCKLDEPRQKTLNTIA